MRRMLRGASAYCGWRAPSRSCSRAWRRFALDAGARQSRPRRRQARHRRSCRCEGLPRPADRVAAEATRSRTRTSSAATMLVMQLNSRGRGRRRRRRARASRSQQSKVPVDRVGRSVGRRGQGRGHAPAAGRRTSRSSPTGASVGPGDPVRLDQPDDPPTAAVADRARPARRAQRPRPRRRRRSSRPTTLSPAAAQASVPSTVCGRRSARSSCSLDGKTVTTASGRAHPRHARR